jgi:hypothetical protein
VRGIEKLIHLGELANSSRRHNEISVVIIFYLPDININFL